MVDKVVNLFGAIVVLAVVTTIVSHGTATAGILRAWGDTFSHSVSSAMGK